MQIRSGNNMVNKRNHLMYHFQHQFISTLPVFKHKILFKKLARNAHSIKCLILIEGSRAPWLYMCSYNWLIS